MKKDGKSVHFKVIIRLFFHSVEVGLVQLPQSCGVRTAQGCFSQPAI